VPLFFCPDLFSIFVLRSKRMDMLNAITWGQFSIFIMVVSGVYYLYVFVSYYGAEVFGRISGKRSASSDFDGIAKDSDNNGFRNEPDLEATANQAELFKSEGPNGGGDKQFQAMQRAIAVIRQVIAQGIENKLDRENLLDHIREVLGGFRQLRKTEYAETIDNFLIRVCSSELSLELGEGELAGLWK
jgi:hypothetical protein